MLTKAMMDPSYKDKPFYLGKYEKLMNERLKSLKPPCEVTRYPQDLEEKWKASKFRHFILYYSLVIFKDLLPKSYYNHWFLKVYSLHIFLKDS